MNISLSTYDPVDSQEGALDPLGLNPIADRMGSRLTPGVRERMRHPRFLTTIAVGVEIYRPSLGEVAKDGITPPHIVFEWYVVQALFKTYRDTDDIRGIPGILKAREAWTKKDSLSHNRYLKNAPIFGFNGVYKTLSEELKIVTDGIIGENGDRLLRIWSEEQNLPGFYGTEKQESAGKVYKNILRNAIAQGMEKGEVAAPWNWQGFEQIAAPLAVYKPGPKERAFVLSLLLNNEKGYRQPLLENLPSFVEKNEGVNWTEKQFHESLLKLPDENLRDMLKTIISYENFARLLTNSFYDLLYFLSDKNRKVPISEIMVEKFANPDIKYLRDLYESTYQYLMKFGESNEFENYFGAFSFINTHSDFLITLINHHQNNQKRKPPFGKAPWLECFTDGTYIIRPLYKQDDPISGRNDYVNSYRIRALMSFLTDLKDH